MLTSFWKRQFTLNMLYPVHRDPHIFIASQWQKYKTEPNLKYLIYRTIVMLIFFVTWIISIARESGAGKWPIFLTNWGYTVCICQAIMAWFMLLSAILGNAFNKLSKMKEIFLKCYPAYWLLNTIATSSAVAITTIYWIVIYDAETMMFDAMNYFVHGNNSILMFLDLWIVAHPVRPAHAVYPVLFGVVYTIFSLTYFLAGGTSKDGSRYIYKIVDWEKPLLTIGVCIGVIAFLIFLHMMMVLIFLVRRNIEEKCCSKKFDVSVTETKRQAVYVNEAISNDIV